MLCCYYIAFALQALLLQAVVLNLGCLWLFLMIGRLMISGMETEHACCVQEATFHPHINQHSQEIMQERRGSNASASFLNRLEADMHGRKMRLQVRTLSRQAQTVPTRLAALSSSTHHILLLCSLTEHVMLKFTS